MLLALLYDPTEYIHAAALACEHEPYGDRFWHDYYCGEVERRDDYETAYIDITDPELSSRLLGLGTGDGFRDGRMAAQAVEDYVNRRRRIGARTSPRAA